MNIFDKLHNSSVLVQLSGGKDSIATLHMLITHNIECQAIHFVHQWGYKLPTEEAKRICCLFGIRLEIRDITEKLSEALLNCFTGRPCRVCKGIMDRMTVEYAQSINAEYICTGDSKSDRALFRRLKDVSDINDMYINRYFSSSFELPEKLKILRPLAEMENDDVFRYLDDNNIKVRRVGDTGDKYFEYSREGCPLQFKDYGVSYTLELMEQLKVYNEKCSLYASKNNFRASVHLPSKFILTVPAGHSEEVRKNIGLSAFEDVKYEKIFSYVIFVAAGRTLCQHEDVISSMIKRLCERLELEIIASYPYYFHLENGSLSYTITNLSNITISLVLTDALDDLSLNNIMIELFHTNRFSINKALAKGEAHV